MDLIVKSLFEMEFLYVFQKLLPNEHVLKIFALSFIHMDFISSFCKISQ
jgi:hypothetical protein